MIGLDGADKMEVYSPSALTMRLEELIGTARDLKRFMLVGEVTQCKKAASGHYYITLKDGDNGVASCVMYKWQATSLKFEPKLGMKVRSIAEAMIYQGNFQIKLYSMEEHGKGDLKQAFEEMLKKLDAEGLFDMGHKKKLPLFPKKIGILTSDTGAVIQDMLRLLGDNWPLSEVVKVPVPVQGAGAAKKIAEAIEFVNENQLCDVMIVGRGGGSAEDLWEFNEEVLARAIFDSEIPVISAVGHEPDVTIADYVADCRAATPSHAIRLVAPEKESVRRWFMQKETMLKEGLVVNLERKKEKVQIMNQSDRFRDPTQVFQWKAQQVLRITRCLQNGWDFTMQGKNGKLNRYKDSIHALSPEGVLGRGYALPWNKKGEVIRSVSEAVVGEEVTLQLKDGAIYCKIEKTTRK